MRNAGKYNKRIKIVREELVKNSNGFDDRQLKTVLSAHAEVKTTRGFTLIASGSDFESATTNFTIRYPKTRITRDMLVLYNDREYRIDYLNNINEDDIELEIQATEVTK